MKSKSKKLKCDSGRNATKRSGAKQAVATLASGANANNVENPSPRSHRLLRQRADTALRPLLSLRYAVAAAVAVVIISVLAIFTIVKAGNITPPTGEPTAQFYTLSEIYEFITNNTTATEGGHSFAFSDGLSSTHHTLTEIYNALASLISADKVLSGTTYLGVAGTYNASNLTDAVVKLGTNYGTSSTGTLVPSGGTAAASDVLSGKTYFGDSQLDWNLKTGAMADNGAFGLTCGVSDQQVTSGYYSGGTLTGSANLLAENIKSGISIFGVSGSLITNPLYGDNDPDMVLNTAANPGNYDPNTCSTTYDTSHLNEGTVKSGTVFGNSQTGTLTPDGGTAASGDLFNGKTAHLTGDWNLDTGTLNLACNTAVFDGSGNLVADGYDGAGIGNNRWCMTDSGDVAANEMKTGKIAWVDGVAITGTGTQTLVASSETVSAGYYDATTLSAVDTDLAAGNILSGKTIFGIAGTVVAGYLYGDNIQSTVLTTAAGAGTYNAANLSTATVKKGTAFGVSSTGAYSGYPGTGWTGTPAITQTACDAQNGSDWYWFEDGNGDGDTTDPEDGVCVKTTAGTAGSWNGYKYTTNYDNTYIAAYTCSGSFPNGTVATYSGLDSAGNPDTTWNDGDCALCQADCYDGQKDLPDQGGYTSNPGGSTGYSGPITPEVLKNWKGTRLPTANDFFGFCGATNGDADSTAGDSAYHSSGASADTTIGNYGKNVGRGTGSEYMDLSNSGNYEWLSEQLSYSSARIAGVSACSYFYYNGVHYSNRFRAVFRP